jgi:hypothetical protein
MKQKTKDSLKLAIGIILTIFLIILIADIIKELLTLIFKDSLNKIVFNIIHFILIYTAILLSFKTKPIKFLEKEITAKFKKSK